MVVNGDTFWTRVENELISTGRTIKELSASMDIPYSTLIDARRRKSYPRADILYKISRFLGLTVDALLSSSDIPQSLQRINRIRRACLVATEEDLQLVERILRLDSFSAVDEKRKHANLRT